jgi:hypothetical protein
VGRYAFPCQNSAPLASSQKQKLATRIKPTVLHSISSFATLQEAEAFQKQKRAEETVLFTKAAGAKGWLSQWHKVPPPLKGRLVQPKLPSQNAPVGFIRLLIGEGHFLGIGR